MLPAGAALGALFESQLDKRDHARCRQCVGKAEPAAKKQRTKQKQRAIHADDDNDDNDDNDADADADADADDAAGGDDASWRIDPTPDPSAALDALTWAPSEAPSEAPPQAHEPRRRDSRRRDDWRSELWKALEEHGVAPRTAAQTEVVGALRDEGVEIAFIIGPAGTGKTMLAL
jgi:hypothetical protein